MPQFLVALYRPSDYDPATEDAAMSHDIDVLNAEMIAAGVRVFVGGLAPPAAARTVVAQAGGQVVVTPGLHVAAGGYIGGLWVLDAADADAAFEWGRKASLACRAPVEVRAFLSPAAA